MFFFIFVAIAAFGCGRVRFTKKEIKTAEENYLKNMKKPFPVIATRNGIQSPISGADLTVGDKILLSAGDIIPADCVILLSATGIVVDESHLTGETTEITKKNVTMYNRMILSKETVAFAQTKVLSGNAFAVVLAVG